MTAFIFFLRGLHLVFALFFFLALSNLYFGQFQIFAKYPVEYSPSKFFHFGIQGLNQILGDQLFLLGRRELLQNHQGWAPKQLGRRNQPAGCVFLENLYLLKYILITTAAGGFCQNFLSLPNPF